MVTSGGVAAIGAVADTQQITIDGSVYGQTGIDQTGNTSAITVNGSLQGASVGALLQGNNDTFSVGSQGAISGNFGPGIEFTHGLNASGNPSTFNTLANAGTIQSGGDAGVSVLGGGGDSFTNSGTISGQSGMTFASNAATETVENSGTITGTTGVAISSIQFIDPFGDIFPSVGITVTNDSSGVLSNAAANTVASNGVPSGVLYFDDGAGTSSSINNQGTITGDGYVIQSVSDALNISNSGSIHGGLDSSADITLVNSGLWQTNGDSNWLLNGSTNSVTNSGRIEDSILMGGTDTIFNSGLINQGITIKSSSGSDKITNTGTINQDLFLETSGSDVINNSGQISGGVTLDASNETVHNALLGILTGPVNFNGANNVLTNDGAINGNVTGPTTLTNNGQITGNVTGSTTITNSGQITGNVALAASDTLNNSGGITGNVTLGASDTMNNTGTVHGNLTLAASDTVNSNGGSVTGGVIQASTSDLLGYAGLFGHQIIDGFLATGPNHDTLQFAANDFTSFGKLHHAMSQHNGDTVITLDANDSITLVGVQLRSLVSTDVKFV
jgi:hypothetical protein